MLWRLMQLLMVGVNATAPDPDEEDEGKWEKKTSKKQEKKDRQTWDKVIKERTKSMILTYTGAGTSRNQNPRAINIILEIANLQEHFNCDTISRFQYISNCLCPPGQHAKENCPAQTKNAHGTAIDWEKEIGNYDFLGTHYRKKGEEQGNTPNVGEVITILAPEQKQTNIQKYNMILLQAAEFIGKRIARKSTDIFRVNMETLRGPAPESLVVDFHGCSLERKLKAYPESIDLKQWFKEINVEYTKEVRRTLYRWQEENVIDYNEMKRVDIPNIYFNIYGLSCIQHKCRLNIKEALLLGEEIGQDEIHTTEGKEATQTMGSVQRYTGEGEIEFKTTYRSYQPKGLITTKEKLTFEQKLDQHALKYRKIQDKENDRINDEANKNRDDIIKKKAEEEKKQKKEEKQQEKEQHQDEEVEREKKVRKWFGSEKAYQNFQQFIAITPTPLPTTNDEITIVTITDEDSEEEESAEEVEAEVIEIKRFDSSRHYTEAEAEEIIRLEEEKEKATQEAEATLAEATQLAKEMKQQRIKKLQDEQEKEYQQIKKDYTHNMETIRLMNKEVEEMKNKHPGWISTMEDDDEDEDEDEEEEV